MKAFKYIAILLLAGCLLGGCSEDKVDYYDPTYNGLRFKMDGSSESDLPGSYDTNVLLFVQSFTFRSLEDPSVAYYDLEIPLVWIGIPPVTDMSVDVRVEEHENNAAADQFEIISASIPEGNNRGSVKLRLFNSEELLTQTRELYLKIHPGENYMVGPKNYLDAHILWNATVELPAGQTRMTYNMMIKSPVAWSSTSTAYVSAKGVSVILDATGWSELPRYGLIYVGNLYQSWARKVGDYIAKYNAEHPDDILRHDSGSLKGEPIEARTY